VAHNRSRVATVLVVEDEPLLRVDLAEVLSNMGYRVLEASDAEAAIRLLERCPEIIAVITDRNMPGAMDGLALAHVVRKRWPPCALIMVSGEHRPGESEFPAGMRFLSKPVGARSLRATLGELGAGLI
jgi:CheY-like chemotaxis protein